MVAFESYNDEWLATIGAVNDTHSAEYSVEDIARWGAKLLPQEAHGFFLSWMSQNTKITPV